LFEFDLIAAFTPVRRDGLRVNHKRVLRLYREEGLWLRRRKRKGCQRGCGSPWPSRRRRGGTGRWIS